MREIKFIQNNIYHVFNRGTEKRSIFLSSGNYVRFIHNLFEFNNSNPLPRANVRFRTRNPKDTSEHQITQCLLTKRVNIQKPTRALLVDILCFALMPNHFHLLLRQREENGIQRFMHKIGMGYGRHFNEKYKRTGRLFQGTYKAVPIEHDRQLLHLPYYIHLNPLDLKYPGWRKNELPNHKNAMKFLETYRWSSYLDYTGTKNFPSVTERDFLSKFLGGAKQHKKDLQKWLKERERNLNIMGDITLE